jgi:hypothetical protein
MADRAPPFLSDPGAMTGSCHPACNSRSFWVIWRGWFRQNGRNHRRHDFPSRREVGPNLDNW